MIIEAASLQGMRVLLTRPEPKLGGIREAIERAGGSVNALPLIVIEPLSDEACLQKIKASILELDRYAFAIFVSSNAAEIGMDWIDNYWPQLPQDLVALSVGPGTAAVLERFSWPVSYPAEGVTSEALLAMPILQDVADKRIALFRGLGGREVLAEALRERGAEVDYLELYERRVPVYSREALKEAFCDPRPDVLVATSAQIFLALQALLTELDNSGVIMQLPLIVPSERVAELAKEAGFLRVFNAGGASDERIMQCLSDIKSELAL